MAWFRVRIPAVPFRKSLCLIRNNDTFGQKSSNRRASREALGKTMKPFILLGIACAAMLLTGCRTVAVVDSPGYYGRTGYYGRPGYYASRPYYYRGGRQYYYGSSNRYYRGGYYGRTYNRGYYGDRAYYRGPARSATVVVR